MGCDRWIFHGRIEIWYREDYCTEGLRTLCGRINCYSTFSKRESLFLVSQPFWDLANYEKETQDCWAGPRCSTFM